MSLGKHDGRRIRRVEKEVHQSIANFVLMKMREELGGFVTITRVVMPGDLKSAKVYVNAPGESKERDLILDVLQSKAYEIQRYLNETLSLRFCPKLRFFHDEGFDQLLKVDEVLYHIKSPTGSDGSSLLEPPQES